MSFFFSKSGEACAMSVPKSYPARSAVSLPVTAITGYSPPSSSSQFGSSSYGGEETLGVFPEKASGGPCHSLLDIADSFDPSQGAFSAYLLRSPEIFEDFLSPTSFQSEVCIKKNKKKKKGSGWLDQSHERRMSRRRLCGID